MTVKNRRPARTLALQALYEIDFTDHPVEKVTDRAPLRKPNRCRTAYIYLSPDQWRARKQNPDRSGHSALCPEWPLDQVAGVDRNILRIAIYEFAIWRDTPTKVAINEAVELAKEFGSESASRFVNGVLGTLAAHERCRACRVRRKITSMNIMGIGRRFLSSRCWHCSCSDLRKMIQYAYQAGRYISQLRAMWEQTMQTVSKEFKEAGLDVPPEMLRGRFDIGAEAMKVINQAPTAAVVPIIVPPVAPIVSATDTTGEPPSVPLMTPTDTANVESSDNQPSLNLPPDDEQPRKYDAWLPS